MSRRVPWRAALFSVATTGLGQLYCGRPFRAAILYLLSGAIGLIALWVVFVPLRPWNIVVPVASALLWAGFILADSIQCAIGAAPDYRLKAYNRWYVYLLLTALAWTGHGALKPVLHAGFVQAFMIPSASMLPTLMPGDAVFVNKRAYLGRMPQRGDLVAFRYPLNPSVMFAKRAIAVGGDVIKLEDKKVYVNGQPLVEPYAFFEYPTTLPLRDDFPPTPGLLETLPDAWGLDPTWKREMPSFIHAGSMQVPPDCVFVLGDNRDNSLDSRFWGFVARADLVGKAGVIYFSWDAKAHRVRWDRIGEVPK
ncbi:MAG: signal peptidase I [Terriglobia bacterium]